MAGFKAALRDAVESGDPKAFVRSVVAARAAWRGSGGSAMVSRQKRIWIKLFRHRHPGIRLDWAANDNPTTSPRGPSGGRPGRKSPGKRSERPGSKDGPRGPEPSGARSDEAVKLAFYPGDRGDAKLRDTQVRGPFGLGDDAVILVPGGTLMQASNDDFIAEVERLLPERTLNRFDGQFGARMSRRRENIHYLPLPRLRLVIAENVSESDAHRLRDAGHRILPNLTLEVCAEPATGAPTWPWRPNAEDWWSEGSGVVIGHIDSGADCARAGINGRVRASWVLDDETGLQRCQAPEDVPELDPKDHHGTATAALAAGDGHGVAREAELLIAAILKPDGNSVSDMRITAMAMAITHFVDFIATTDDRLVINMAFRISSRGSQTAAYADLLSQLDPVIGQRIVAVAAIGNEAEHGFSGGFPAREPSVIAIGAHNANGVAAEFSEHGHARGNPQRLKPDFHAPGVDVPVPTDVGVASGSSVGCALAAGVIARILGSQRGRTMNNQELYQYLVGRCARIVLPDGTEWGGPGSFFRPQVDCSSSDSHHA